MKYNVNSMVSTEAIAYQKPDFFYQLTGLSKQFRDKQLNVKEYEKAVSAAIKKRFNFDIEFKVITSNQVNAYMQPPTIDPNNIQWYNSFGRANFEWVQKHWQNDGAKAILKKIAKGDLSATGWVDYKNARVNGLFAQLPARRLVVFSKWWDIAEVTDEIITSVILHEIGHHWATFETLGVYTSRNAIISSAIADYLNTQNDEEKINIILEQKNVWNLPIDEKLVTKLNNEDATKIIISGYLGKFKDDVGYVQYDDNFSEVIADQFAIRMGGVPDVEMIMHKLGLGGSGDIAEQGFKFTLTMIAVGVAGLGVSLAAAPIAWMAPIFGMAAGISLIETVSALIMTKQNNGAAYDNAKDRWLRNYREMLGYLKQGNITPEETKRILTILETNKKMLDQIPNTDVNWTHRIMMFFSKGYKEQNAKKLYQQLTEELLANELYVMGHKFKQLGVQ